MELIRGDTGRWGFSRLDADGEIIASAPYAIYFTVKKSFKTQDFLIQKVYDSTDPENSDIKMDKNGVWHIVVYPEDTDNLAYKTYVYDLEVIQDSTKTASGAFANKQTISKGNFKITDEATWTINENGA